MAVPSDSEIERTLRAIVQKVDANEEITIKKIRQRAEKRLGLGEGFLKEGGWKARSNAIIRDELDEGNEEQPQETVAKSIEAPTPKSKENSAEQRKTPNDIKREEHPEPQKKSSKAAATPSVSSRPSTSDAPAKGASSAGKQAKPITPKVNGTKRKASDASSSAESSEDAQQTAESGPPQKRQKSVTPSTSSEESGSTASESEDERPTPQAVETPRRPAEEIVQSTTQAIPATRYQPPPGFTLLDASQLERCSDLGSLEGKQIWHITAPSDIPMSSLQSLTFEAITTHQSVLNHNNTDFALNEDITPGIDHAAVLEPSHEGYASKRRKVDRTLHLQPKITLPNLSSRQASQVTGSKAAGNVAEASISTIRPQPKGLRMTYRPPGSGSGDLGAIGSDSEGGDEDDRGKVQPGFQFPKALGGHGPSKRTVGEQDVDMVDADVSTPVAKLKKKRKEKSVDLSQTPQVNGINSAIKTEAPAVQPIDGGVMSASPQPTTNGAPLSKEEKEAKARRKEEKRLKRERKAAKRRAKEGSASA